MHPDEEVTQSTDGVDAAPAGGAGTVGLEHETGSRPAALDGAFGPAFESELRRALPPMLEALFAEGRVAGKPEVDEEVRALREELASSRLEIERLRNEKAKQDRDAYVREQMRSMGVANIELALRAVRDDIVQQGDGGWTAAVGGEAMPAEQYLRSFVGENPELMPARRTPGVGVPARTVQLSEECDLDEIRPGMDAAAMRRAREAVVRIIAQRKRTL